MGRAGGYSIPGATLIFVVKRLWGFAKGAVWAAERLAGKTGVFEFGELLKEVQ